MVEVLSFQLRMLTFLKRLELRALRRGATVKMPRMAVSMGITGLSKNLLQMHVREECLHSNLKLVVYLKEMFGTGNLQ
ncbi:hypothetical protein Tco_0393205 [Tanacetum coccineum]